jgi:hypothetical protein
MNKRTLISAANALDKARELMNDNGRHWIKGQLSGKKNGEVAYCSLGGIDRASKRNSKANHLAKVLLAEIITGEERPSKREPYPNQTELTSMYRDRTWAQNKIWRYNDSPNTRWSGVSTRFKKAAKKARKLAEGKEVLDSTKANRK